MNNVAVLVEDAVFQSAQRPERVESPLIRKLFLLMHGAYGSLFISKYATGEKDSAGKDKGIRAAMMVWAARLDRFPGAVVEMAVDRLGESHAKFPPNLPEFESLCVAAMPREEWVATQGLPRLPAPVVVPPAPVSFELRKDGKDWARLLMARHERGDVLRMAQLQYARQALGIVA